MFQKILLATDGSKVADNAAEAALGLVEEFEDKDREIILLHVSDSTPTRSQVMQADLDVQSVLREKADKAVASTEGKFKEADVDFKLEVALGDPADMIVEFARENGVDLIIIGSRGLGSVSSVLLGSVSRRVAQEAPCPVMIVK